MNELREKNLRVYSGFTVTPKGWDEATVGEICDLGRGRVISQDEINAKPGPFPVFSSQTRNNGEMGRLATFDFSGEYVTWTTDGENDGTVFFRSGQFNCTNVCGTLRPKSSSDLDVRFLTYQLGSVAKRYVSYIGNPKLMNGVMASVALILPPRKQQRRIAEILLTVDAAMEQAEALIAKYQQIKAGLMHDLFTRGVWTKAELERGDHKGLPSEASAKEGQLRPTRAQAPQLYLESSLGWIPKEWEVVSLQELVSPNRPIVYGILMPGTGFDGGIPVVKVKDIKDGEIQTDDLLLTSRAIDAQFPRSKLKAGDILLTIRGTVGRLAEVPAILNEANITQDTARIGITRGVSNYVRFFWSQMRRGDTSQ